MNAIVATVIFGLLLLALMLASLRLVIGPSAADRVVALEVVRLHNFNADEDALAQHGTRRVLRLWPCTAGLPQAGAHKEKDDHKGEKKVDRHATGHSNRLKKSAHAGRLDNRSQVPTRRLPEAKGAHATAGGTARGATHENPKGSSLQN